ncbi:MAG: hypothetical protein K8R77_03335 [Anaerolineaceae bacterium]|nr:hypothetical protein [Anaerolineaceae bacterium]
MKLIAENVEENASKQLNQISSAMFTLGSLTGTAGILITGLFSKTISGWVFGSPDYSGYVLICVLASFFVFQYLFLLNIFRGLLKWKIFTLASIASTAVSLIVTIILIVLFNIDGGIWALLVSQICSVLVALYYYRRKIQPRHSISFLNIRPTRRVMHLLGKNIGPIVIIQIIIALSRLVIRSQVIQQLGLEQNGLIQLSTGISDGYMGLILAILMSYILPKIAADGIKDSIAAHQTQNDGLRFLVLIITPTLAALLASRQLWIPLLYSRAFLAAQGILIWQFLSDFFLVIRQCLNIDLVPTNRFLFFSLDGILYAAGTILLTSTLLPQLGISAVVISSLIINVALTLLSLTYHLRRTTFRINSVNWWLLAKASVLLCAGFAAAEWIPNLWTRTGIVSVILAMMLMFLPKKGELKNFWQNLIPSLIRQGWSALHSTSTSPIDELP